MARDVAVEVRDDTPSTFRAILRELPRRKLALVLLVVMVNLGAVTYLRCRAVGRERWSNRFIVPGARERSKPFVPPWEWDADEWRQTVWPWRK